MKTPSAYQSSHILHQEGEAGRKCNNGMNACSISWTWWQMSISSGASFIFPLLCIPGLRQHPDLMASSSSSWRALSFPFLSDSAALTSSPSPFPLQPHSMKVDGGNAVGHKPKPLRIEKYIRRCLKKNIYIYVYISLTNDSDRFPYTFS